MAFKDSNTASCTIAAYRAWANGFWPSATAVFTAITFQSNTTSAFATADPNRVAINMHRPRNRFFVSPYIFFIVLPPDFSLLSVVVIGIFAATEAVVHIGECVAALCFVSL